MDVGKVYVDNWLSLRAKSDGFTAMNEIIKERLETSLGDRMKTYERIGAASQSLMPRLPVVVRLDGRAFHSFTRSLDRPFDERFMAAMDATAGYLVEKTGAVIGYTQSDEITLILFNDKIGSQIFFDGHRDKINSVLAAMCSVRFNRKFEAEFGEIRGEPVFDCRCFTVPSKTEAVNCLIWREMDATRNAISMLAQSKFSHKQLHKKSSAEMQEMLFSEHGINFNDLESGKKRGRYFRRVSIEQRFSDEEISRLPENHHARKNFEVTYIRSKAVYIDMPILTKVVNREGVVFNKELPEME
jgi:tRNA(His) guanylyltransferase